MTGVLAVFRHELRLLLFSPLSYMFQIGFLGGVAAFIFLVADFYATDEASLRLFAVFLPWVALILVPALAMRAWPDSHNDRSVELALTLPVSSKAVVLGKFLAGYLVLLVTLAFTLPMAATVAYLGAPDLGTMAATYLAAALLLAVYYALSLFAAALVREPVGAFIAGLLILLLLLLLGWDVFARLLKLVLPPGLIDAFALYSPYHWNTAMSGGMVELAALFYFLAVSAAALWATADMVDARRMGSLSSTSRLRLAGRWLVGLAVLAVAIPVVAERRAGFDLTEAKEFTLHEGTRRILARLPSDTQVTLFWSAHEASVPANIKSHARRIRALLREMATASGGRLTIDEIDPRPDTDEELDALGRGVQRIPMSSGENFFLGLAAQQGQRQGNIPYLDIRRDRLTEYDIALTLNGLARKETPKIGLLSPLVPSEAAIANRVGMSFIAELKRAYDLAVIPFFKPALPQDLDVLVLIDTAILRAEMLYEIDQFVMKGGQLVVMIDPYLRVNRASNAVNPEPSEEINDITDLLLRYGLAYRPNDVAGDQNAASVVADQQQRSLSYPFWMRLRTDSLSKAHPATASLNEVFMVESGVFDVTQPERVTPLVTTSSGSGLLPRDRFSKETPGSLTTAFKADGTPRVIAAAIGGPLTSAFEHPPEGIDPAGHRRNSENQPSVFAFADVDWMFDPFSLQTTEIQGRVITRPLNDNTALLLNILEFASGDRDLANIRSRGKVHRPFTRVETMFKAAQERFRAEESKLAAQIAEGERIMTQMPEAAGVTSIDALPPVLRAEIDRLRRELLPLRRELRTLRRSIREDVETLGRRITVINLAAGPVLVLIFAAGVAAYRRRRGRLA